MLIVVNDLEIQAQGPPVCQRAHTANARDHAAPQERMWKAELLMCTGQEAFVLGLRVCFKKKKSWRKRRVLELKLTCGYEGIP